MKHQEDDMCPKCGKDVLLSGAFGSNLFCPSCDFSITIPDPIALPCPICKEDSVNVYNKNTYGEFPRLEHCCGDVSMVIGYNGIKDWTKLVEKWNKWVNAQIDTPKNKGSTN